jgi:hypothetical protein
MTVLYPSREDRTVKEVPPPPPFDSKRYIEAPKARQMSLKWESFADESFIVK